MQDIPQQPVSSTGAQVEKPLDTVAAAASSLAEAVAVDVPCEAPLTKPEIASSSSSVTPEPVQGEPRTAAADLSSASAAAGNGVTGRSVAAGYLANLSNGAPNHGQAAREPPLSSAQEPVPVSQGLGEADVAVLGEDIQEDVMRDAVGVEEEPAPVADEPAPSPLAPAQEPVGSLVVGEATPEVAPCVMEDVAPPQVEVPPREVPLGIGGVGVVATAVQEVVREKTVVEAKVPAASEEEEEEEEEDQETKEYRKVLVEMLAPVKLEKYVDNFVHSGITLDILPLVRCFVWFCVCCLLGGCVV